MSNFCAELLIFVQVMVFLCKLQFCTKICRTGKRLNRLGRNLENRYFSYSFLPSAMALFLNFSQIIFRLKEVLK